MTVGHNQIDNSRLKSIVQRIERVSEDIAGLQNDRKEIYQEAASAGYDKKIIRQVIAARKKDKAEVEEQLSLFDMYYTAVSE